MQPPVDELAVGASGEEVRRASEWLEANCLRNGVPQAKAGPLVLCLNEVLANVIDHGGESARSEPIRLRFEFGGDQGHGRASVTVSDAGVAFNPLSFPTRVLPRTLEDATPRGMGLEIIRRCANSLEYRRENGRNHLTFETRWSAQ